ncbi:MAG TPA: double-strand break repair helicase AddA [Phenylobacterium sp.]|nr:double-strand break repair helicase AddA [Phenylobacterium sp.]
MSQTDPQALASDPDLSAFVLANAGSGKTTTLVDRVARLLLAGADPAAILCVTYTKAAASEMQRRLFDKLGAWAVADDADLARELAKIDETRRDLPRARRLFARALETPGGLKIQTIHAFCEKLLRRFPLEAGVSPGFALLEDAAAAAISAEARETVALLALDKPDSDLGRAYARLAVQVDVQTFEALFGVFEARREAIAAFVAGAEGGLAAAVYALCGLPEVTPSAAVEAAILAELDKLALDMAIEALRGGSVTDARLAERLHAWASAPAGFDTYFANFCTGKGEPLKSMATKAVDPAIKAWLETEQQRLADACKALKAARVAEGTLDLLYLAQAHAAAYEGAKAARRGLDFGDLIARARDLLTRHGAAAWVLYKLEGGIEHLLLDEAQDTAPEQWDIVRALTAEFFAAAPQPGRQPRSVFAVGDPKQSIYSFQGAQPGRLLTETRAYQQLVQGAGRDFSQVDLLVSYRSTPQVLAFVDAVFGTPEATAALAPATEEDPPGAIPLHQAARAAEVGCVDVWPLEEAQESAEPETWWTPLDAEPAESAAKRLARRIAREIAGMIARREGVYVKGGGEQRPMRPGDVLILVRRRKALFHEIIRALKREGVPVGGQDRLTLSDHIVFKDLMALAAFARFPDDDLTLAALLRSPFTDMDEESLFDLAWKRKGSLWAALGARHGERADWAAAHAVLQVARRSAEAGPFAFVSRLLGQLDGEGRSMRQRLLTRLGREAEDALDAFLAQALKLESQGVHDLEDFCARMSASAVEVKREQEESAAEGPGEVQVMTVHGAKGLERPVVILPDTTSTARAQGPGFLPYRGGFLWSARKDDDCEASAEARAARDLATTQESMRLLYVALTRARDRLIVCGARRGDRLAGFEAGCWYETIDQALARSPLAEAVRSVEVAGQAVRRFGPDPACLAAGAVSGAGPADGLPGWARKAAAPDPLARYASPTALAEAAQGPAPSPLASRDGLGRYRRGTLVHRLLQLLPDLPEADRRSAAQRLLAREHDLSDPQRAEMAAAALGVIEDPRFAAVFGPKSRAEAPIAGRAAAFPEGLSVSGRLDRLVVRPDRVLVVDFKTNRPAPARVEDADPGYILQMALYVAVLREAFPGRAVEAALIWTDGPKLMPVPENLIAEALAKLGREVEAPGSAAYLAEP